jgi:hypothetical protein
MAARMDYVLNGTGSDGLRVPVEVEVEMVET